MKTDMEKILFESDGKSIEEIGKQISGLIIQKKRWIGTYHPDNKIRIEALKQSNISVGKDVFVSQGLIILDSKKYNPIVTIGDRCAFGSNVQLIGGSSPNNSYLKLVPYVKNKLIKERPIYIGKDSWIGCGVIILPGIKIGKNCVIGAGSIVTRDTNPHSIYEGSPAKYIRRLKK